MFRDDIRRVSNVESAGKTARKLVKEQHLFGARTNVVQSRTILEHSITARKSPASDGGETVAFRDADLDVRGCDVLINTSECVDDQWIVHRSAPLIQNTKRIRIGESRSIRPIRRQRVEAIDYRKNSRTDRDVAAF